MTSSADTIFALSSGRLPAAIAIMRISGPAAGATLTRLAGPLPPERRAVRRLLRDRGDVLDDALILWLPGPRNATGEDLAELHLHGGRAVVAAVEQVLGGIDGLRAAEAGEFTRRALLNGRIDLTAAEGLADLLLAETESQRRAALDLAQGGLARDVTRWRTALLRLSAAVEAEIDFADEAEEGPRFEIAPEIDALVSELRARTAAPTVERLRDGVRVVLLGPPNAGKSTLLNALVERDAAIVSPHPGTTRDTIEIPVSIDGVPFVFIDTAGLRVAGDVIERMGIERAEAQAASADIVLWLGDDPPSLPDADRTIPLHPRADQAGRDRPAKERLAVSARTGAGMTSLRNLLIERSAELLPSIGEPAMNQRHRNLAIEVADILARALRLGDPLLVAEELRLARQVVDRISGGAGTENMLDHLFGSLCIGK